MKSYSKILNIVSIPQLSKYDRKIFNVTVEYGDGTTGKVTMDEETLKIEQLKRKLEAMIGYDLVEEFYDAVSSKSFSDGMYSERESHY